jgi:TIR domain
VKPRVFISYARSDAPLADVLEEALVESGFAVFMDRSELDPGESFPQRIADELRRADGLVALVSAAFASSRWCQAEVYVALAQAKVVIPVLVGSASLAQLDDPLQRLTRDVQQAVVRAQPSLQELRSAVARPLERARQRARRRRVWEVLRVSAPLVAIGAAAWFVSVRVESWEANRRRQRVLDSISQSTSVLPARDISTVASSLAGDRSARSEAVAMAGDPSRSATARLNALLLSASLAPGYPERRWDVQDLSMKGVTLEREPLVDVTFRRGDWRDVRFSRMTWAGVTLTGGLDMGLVGARFDRVAFLGVLIDDIKALEVTFTGARFRGGEVNVTNFAKVRFEPFPLDSSDPNPTITPDLALFEGTLLRSAVEPPRAGVIDLSTPEDHVVFDGVMFVGVRFEGWFDPAWFRNSSFEECILPQGVTVEQLERGGNRVVGSAR